MFKEKVNAHTDRQTHDRQWTMTEARWPMASGANKLFKFVLNLLYSLLAAIIILKDLESYW